MSTLIEDKPRKRVGRQPGTNRAAPSLPLDAGQLLNFRSNLMAWYRVNARVLPWRGIDDAYCIWVSEIMLQQTRVDTVIAHFERFTQRFPTMLSLALTTEEDVLAMWSGLGYYRRARMLHRAAKFLVEEHNGVLPHTAHELEKIPGIGSYTSAAIASIAFGQHVATVDGNVERVLFRIAGRPQAAGVHAEEFIAAFAQALLDPDDPGSGNQAMMELGATVCLPRSPLCLQCPVFDLCRTRGEHAMLPRKGMLSARIGYALAIRVVGRATQVLLHRRAAGLALMPGMWELPPLHTPPDETPRMRMRHAIVGTNYYIEVYPIYQQSEVVERMLPAPHQAGGQQASSIDDKNGNGHGSRGGTDEEHKADAADRSAVHPETYPHFSGGKDPELRWTGLPSLHGLPLTGLARKVLMRAGMLTVGF